jgi:hypothetical protein
MRSKVDFPHPEGPTKTVKEPSAISMSTPCRMGTCPNFLLTDWMLTLAIRIVPEKLPQKPLIP